jgi:hypothetical protein
MSPSASRLAIALLLLGPACGEKGGASNGDAGADTGADGAQDGADGGVSASAILSGALNKTISCKVTQAFWGYALAGQSRLAVDCKDDTTTMSLGVTAQGELTNGATLIPSMSASFIAQVFNSTDSWGSRSGIDKTLGGGSGSISLSTVTTTASTATSKDYLVHGTATLSLPGFAKTSNSSVVSTTIVF